MRRRDFLTLAGAATAFPQLALASQRPTKRLGFIVPRAEDDPLAKLYRDTFWAAVGKHGWDENNLLVDYRWSADTLERAAKPSAELLALKPDVLFAVSTSPLAVLAALTQTVPIVFAYVTSIALTNLRGIQSYAHPGGNITGFAAAPDSEGQAKSIDLLREMMPTVRGMAVIYNPISVAGGDALFTSSFASLMANAKVRFVPYPVRTIAEISAAVSSVASDRSLGLIVSADSYLASNRATLIAEVARYRLTAIGLQRSFAADGGLMSFAPDPVPLIRGGAEYAGLVLNGAKPGDLPIQTSQLSLTVNLRTARTLGITVPITILARADEVLE